MNKLIAVIVLILGTSSLAFAKSPQAGKTYVEGRVLYVERRQISQSTAGENPTDASLSDPKTYVYEIAIRVNCETYVGRRETWHETGFAPNEKVRLRLTPSTMYVYRTDRKEVKIKIVSRHSESEPCSN